MYERNVLDVEEVMSALDAMIAAAEKRRRSMSVAVVDAWGGSLGALRMDGASSQSLQYAIKEGIHVGESGFKHSNILSG